ncbi:hypothetical protein D9619_004126 [Psilocybe cf. subviscida]|uniref:BHLH domain-containing protein n=1 Tax=Psilocybe cf. subviscida TaxID=2480587 RepID=A0A8H5BRJ8_9AGAR|nr:hypothetical protein D9619_004126 [Psilocybe cf. subviscida]
MQFSPMQSLLSPAERHAFQSFLSTMDYPGDTLTANEWAIYNAGNQAPDGQEDASLMSEPNPGQREALTKATKDLMSLDAPNSSWEGSGSMSHQHQNLSPQQMYGDHGSQAVDEFEMQHDQHFAHQRQAIQHHRHQREHHHEPQQQNSYSNGRDSFPFVRDEAQRGHSPNDLRYPPHPDHHPQLLTSSLNGHSSHDPSPLSPHSSFQFQQGHSTGSMSMHAQHQQSPHQIHLPSQDYHGTGVLPGQNAQPSTSRLPSQSSRQGAAHAAPSSSSTTRNHSSTSGTGRRSGSVGSTYTNANSQQQSSTSTKQALLSPSQKKANHIQSEQKRRANIRRGYEALCETVPALREAIREEEEAERNSARAGANGQRKKGRAKKGQKEGEDKDKLDGRAGPRSENVVLSKTIDHIQALLADRSALLARLHRARSSLPPGHPALIPLSPDPLWEREWKGGNGKLGDDDPDAEAGSDNDECDEE